MLLFTLEVVVNNPPIITIPEAQTVREDETLTITGISVEDADSTELTVTLLSNNGELNLTTTEGLTLEEQDGVNLAFTGSLDAINNALAGLIYRGNTNFNGNDEIIITVSDLELSTAKLFPLQ